VTEPRGQFVTVGGQLVIVPVVVVTTVDVVHDVLPQYRGPVNRRCLPGSTGARLSLYLIFIWIR
jgi:hypothetical protein